MMKVLRLAVAVMVLGIQCTISWAAYGIRVPDLKRTPTPANPVKTWGKVVSESPLKIADGQEEIELAGIQAKLGDYLVVQGDWNGSVLTLNGPAMGYVGPLKMEMIYIPAGSFSMGNTGRLNDQVWWNKGETDERPLHTVSLSGYWIGKYEVTRGQYRAFINAGGYTSAQRSCWSTLGWNWRVTNNVTQPSFWAASQNFGSGYFTQTDDHPVVGLTYHEAEAFCKWAGGRLLTEAEWEKASRGPAPSLLIYSYGDTYDAEKDNNLNDHNAAGGGYNKSQTAPVGSYPAGASWCGAQDMGGNVWEICKDWYELDYYSQTPAGGWVNPQGPASSSINYRVLRGGGWMYGVCGNSACCNRCANRGKFPFEYAVNTIGVRMGRPGG